MELIIQQTDGHTQKPSSSSSSWSAIVEYTTLITWWKYCDPEKNEKKSWENYKRKKIWKKAKEKDYLENMNEWKIHHHHHHVIWTFQMEKLKMAHKHTTRNSMSTSFFFFFFISFSFFIFDLNTHTKKMYLLFHFNERINKWNQIIMNIYMILSLHKHKHNTIHVIKKDLLHFQFDTYIFKFKFKFFFLPRQKTDSNQ